METLNTGQPGGSRNVVEIPNIVFVGDREAEVDAVAGCEKGLPCSPPSPPPRPRVLQKDVFRHCVRRAGRARMLREAATEQLVRSLAVILRKLWLCVTLGQIDQLATTQRFVV